MIGFFVISLSSWPGVFFLSPCTVDQMTVCGSQPDVEPQVQQPSPQHPEASSLISIRICGLQTLKPIWSSGTHTRFLALVLMHYYDILGGILFVYFWLCWVFVVTCKLSLVVARGGYSPVVENEL